MSKHILHMASCPNRIRTHQNPVPRLKPTTLPLHLAVSRKTRGATTADYIRGVHALAVVELCDALVEEAHCGAVGKEPVAVGFAGAHVAFFVGASAGFAVVEEAFGGYPAGDDVEVVDPPFGGRVEACTGGVVFEVEFGAGGGSSRGGCWCRW